MSELSPDKYSKVQNKSFEVCKIKRIETGSITGSKAEASPSVSDHPAAADAVHEETSRSDHRSVPRGGESLHPPPPPHPAALRHLPRPPALLDLLDPGPAVPGNHRSVYVLSTFTREIKIRDKSE